MKGNCMEHLKQNKNSERDPIPSLKDLWNEIFN